MVRQGMGWVPDDRRIFADLTVGENLEIAERAGAAGEQWDKQKVYDLFPALKEMDSRKGGLLSGGEQKMLAVGRALMTNPQFLLLDEPTEGLAPHVIDDLKQAFKKISEQSTLVIIEQNLPLTAEVADRVYAMKEGKLVAEITDKKEIQDLAFEKYL
jgi:branched-chain amino acid transport system ATP-binding protein